MLAGSRHCCCSVTKQQVCRGRQPQPSPLYLPRGSQRMGGAENLRGEVVGGPGI